MSPSKISPKGKRKKVYRSPNQKRINPATVEEASIFDATEKLSQAAEELESAEKKLLPIKQDQGSEDSKQVRAGTLYE